jgi:hypothetical protein
MQNKIIVPLSGVLDTNLGTITNWLPNPIAAQANLNASQSSGPLASVNTGTSGGSGATFTFATDGSKAVTVTMNTAGSGYAVGDVLEVTIPAGTTEIIADGQDAVVATFEVNEADLVGDESEAFINSPGAGGFWNCLYHSVSGTRNVYKISQIESDHERLWTITTTGSTDNNYKDVSIAIDKAMKKAMQRPNADVRLILPEGIKVASVALS